MTAVLTTIEALRERCAELAATEAQLRSELEEVCEQREQALAELKTAASHEIRLRPLGTTPSAPLRTQTGMPTVEDVRDAVCDLECFAMCELAARLRCTPAQARAALKLVPHLWRDDGKVGTTKVYAYVPPEGPGEAYEADQRLRRLEVVAETDTALPEQVKQSLLGMVRDKDVKKVVRDALQDGWVIEPGTGKHPVRLRRGGELVPIAGNSAHSAPAISRRLRHAS